VCGAHCYPDGLGGPAGDCRLRSRGGPSYVYDLINRGKLPVVKLLTGVPVDGLTEFVSRLARYHKGVGELGSLTPIHMEGMTPIIHRGGGVRRAQRESVQGRGHGTSR
jgi:hypothetical protein